jgi:dTMP kinase
MEKPGQFIVIEGVEGAGKSTAIETVLQVLKENAKEVCTTREPGGTALGEQLRDLLKNPAYQGILEPRAELLMLYAARVQLVEEVIKPAIARGVWVVADRFELSTFAYQGAGRGLDVSMIEALSQFCLNGFQPNLTLFLDVPPEEGMQRVRARGASDRFEKEPIEFFMKIHACYVSYLNKRKDIVRIDAKAPLTEVSESIRNTIQQFIESHD